MLETMDRFQNTEIVKEVILSNSREEMSFKQE